MLGINTNLSSLIAQNSLKQSTNKLNTAIERMSTGCKINHAKDNAANYAISTNMTTKIGSMEVAEENTAMGLDLINTASDNLSLIQERLQRLRDLQEQAINGTYGEDSLRAINAECNSLVDEINRLYFTSEYNGINLFLETTIDSDGKAQILQEVIADKTTKFSDLGITSGSFSVLDSTGVVEVTYDIEENDTIENMLQTLRSHGFNATIDKGTISISSIEGKYVAGDLMIALGIDTQPTTFVDSTEQTSTVEVTYTTSTTISGYTYTTGVAQTSGVLDYTVTTTTTTTETSSFINDIVRRDTRYMTPLSSVDPAVVLTDGTYKISTAAELAQLASMTNAGLISSGDEFVLANNIDISGYSNWTSIGTETNRFSGVFDGNGYNIDSLSMNVSLDGQGLFGSIKYADIKNLGITNVSISSGDESFLAALAGKAGYSKINNCYTTGSITGTGTGVAGLIGYCADNTLVEDCYSTCNISGRHFVGGLLGEMQVGSELRHSFSTGNISAMTMSAGGLVAVCGWINVNTASSTIDSCYSTGTVKAGYYAGGILGEIRGAGITIKDSYTTSTLNNSANSGSFIGGSRESTSNLTTIYIENCFALGKTDGVNNTSEAVFVGRGDSDMNITINNCAYNTEYEATGLELVASTGNIVINNTRVTNDTSPFLISTNSEINNTLLDTTTVTATESTALSAFGLTSNSTINVVSKSTNTAISGTTNVISVTSSTTIGELVTALQGSGLTASFSSGELSIGASDLVYIQSISNALKNEIGISSGTNVSYNTTTIAPVTNTFTHTLSNTTTMGELGLNGSNWVTVASNGTSSRFVINENTTFEQLKNNLDNKGLIVSLNNGIVTLNADSNIYLNSSMLSDLFNLGVLSKDENATYKNLPSSALEYTVNLIEQLGNIYAPGQVNLQVGFNSDSNSSLDVQLSLSLSGYDKFRNIGLDNENYLSQIDDVLETLNQRQVEFGAVIKRLESVLEEISISRDNLVSSRSTLRDADLAEVSAEYIQQQILQQASATLLATANQSPSIALQLI